MWHFGEIQTLRSELLSKLSMFAVVMGEKNCGSEKNRQVKNVGAEGGSGCEQESHEEAG